MGLSSNTKIYIDCRSLLDEILNITVDFPKAYKFTIGTKMQEYSVEALNDISYTLLHIKRAPGYAHQIAFGIPSDARVYYRNSINGYWAVWRRITIV